jgi:hypothetical protein
MIGMVIALCCCYAYIFAGARLTEDQACVLVLAIIIETILEMILWLRD